MPDRLPDADLDRLEVLANDQGAWASHEEHVRRTVDFHNACDPATIRSLVAEVRRARVVHWQPDDRLDGPRCDPADKKTGVFTMTRHRPSLTCIPCIGLVDPARYYDEAAR